MICPRTSCGKFGGGLIAPGEPADTTTIGQQLRAGSGKGVFTACMLAIVPGNFAALVTVPLREVTANPYLTGLWAINFLYLVDVHIATVGYILTLKPLDAHIRTANP